MNRGKVRWREGVMEGGCEWRGCGREGVMEGG